MALPTAEQAAKRRAKGYLNGDTFVPIIYFLTRPYSEHFPICTKGRESLKSKVSPTHEKEKTYPFNHHFNYADLCWSLNKGLLELSTTGDGEQKWYLFRNRNTAFRERTASKGIGEFSLEAF